MDCRNNAKLCNERDNVFSKINNRKMLEKKPINNVFVIRTLYVTETITKKNANAAIKRTGRTTARH